MSVVLVGYGLTMWIRPEQFTALIAYRVISRHVAAELWGSIAIAIGMMLVAAPTLPRRVVLALLAAVSTYWMLVATAIVYGDGINTGVSMYTIMAVVAGIGFARYNPGGDDAEECEARAGGVDVR